MSPARPPAALCWLNLECWAPRWRIPVLGVDARLRRTLLRLGVGVGGQIVPGQPRDPFNPRGAPDRRGTGSEKVCAPWSLVRPGPRWAVSSRC